MNGRMTSFKYSGLVMIVIGALLALFGTTYIVVRSDTVGTYLLSPIWYAFSSSLSPYSGAIVVFVDYTLNAVGTALIVLGIVFATITEERARRIASATLIFVGVLFALAGWQVYQIYRSILIIPRANIPYFPATNVPLLGVVRVVPLMNSLMIDGALFVIGGLILWLLGRKRASIPMEREQERSILSPSHLRRD